MTIIISPTAYAVTEAYPHPFRTLPASKSLTAIPTSPVAATIPHTKKTEKTAIQSYGGKPAHTCPQTLGVNAAKWFGIKL
ncbi:hypothetical protein D3H65_05340 [Paraflavitalea soli]|uniref:Uncharacterized protein n=1 Tax=Paraflavitalea soli TaxID=2315862 RepID=A0A3B7MPD8_9BACT|nr:hypothetical protein D3H65_05340 [Paraflavitalea soli]